MCITLMSYSRVLVPAYASQSNTWLQAVDGEAGGSVLSLAE